MRPVNVQYACLLTREERRLLRIDADDLETRIARSTPEQRVTLERQLGSVHRELLADRATRPKRGRKKSR